MKRISMLVAEDLVEIENAVDQKFPGLKTKDTDVFVNLCHDAVKLYAARLIADEIDLIRASIDRSKY